MNKITYVTSKELTLTKIAAITSLVSLSSAAPLSVAHIPTTFCDAFKSSSTSTQSRLVDDNYVKPLESDRGRKTQKSSRQNSHSHNSLESNSLVAFQQAKYIQDRHLKLKSSLTQTVTLVKELEGFRSSAYVDSDGTVVIGYGMPVMVGKKVKLGDRISQVQAETDLREKLHEIQQHILAAATVELNSHQLIALTSFAFNVGLKPLLKSTLFRKLNARDFSGAANEFPRWNKAHRNGRLVPFAGLTRRRLIEKKLFLTAVN